MNMAAFLCWASMVFVLYAMAGLIPKAIQNAIRVALQLSKNNVNEHIVSELERTNALAATVM